MVKVIIHTDTRYPVNRKMIRKAVLDTLSEFKVENAHLEVSVAVIGARKMKDLSSKFLKDRETHEVLAFPQEEISQSEAGGFVNPPDDILRLGDIVICWPEVLESASREETMVDDQLYFLTGHATEHLLGKRHE